MQNPDKKETDGEVKGVAEEIVAFKKVAEKSIEAGQSKNIFVDKALNIEPKSTV